MTYRLTAYRQRVPTSFNSTFWLICALFTIMVSAFVILSCASAREKELDDLFKSQTQGFFDRYNLFATQAAALAKETQLIQNHPYWQDFASATRRELAKAYVEGYEGDSQTITIPWTGNRKPTDDERRFAERVVQLFDRSKALEGERLYLLNEWARIQLVYLTYLNTADFGVSAATINEMWRQRAREVDQTLNAYGINDLGIFVYRYH